MPNVRVTHLVDAPLGDVWRQLSDIADHVSWMADAAAITFVGERREGVGTTFTCDTRIGPLRTQDRMTVTEWEPPRSLGVRHSGIVTGTGRFTLAPADGDRTTLTWDEDLSFPWYLGGPVTALAAAPVFRLLWAGNLRRFARRVVPATR
jgi:carbon monoxide dehydrogenase subunit G